MTAIDPSSSSVTDATRGTHVETTSGRAAFARSILACPAGATLVVDGVDDVMADLDDLGMNDHGGRPTFSCPDGVALALAAADGRSALLTLESGLGRPGSPERGAVLTLAGRLVSHGTRSCPCCEEIRVVLSLDVSYAVLSRGRGLAGGAGVPASGQVRVEPSSFSTPLLDLNRGFLQRAAEHATASHQHELRSAVASLLGVPIAVVVGVALEDLQADGVTLSWVTPEGARLRRLRFPTRAATPEQVGELLRAELHAGLC